MTATELAPRPAHRAEPVDLVEIGDGWSLWRSAVLRSAGMPFEWLDCLADEGLTARDRVARLLGSPPFLAALAWQNPSVLDNWARAFHETGRLSRPGQREAQIARYAQRYCAKNDTIGFFGPVAWAEFADDEDGLHVVGSLDVRRHGVHLETWAVAQIAASWPAECQPVRPHPAVHVEGGVAHRPWRAPRLLNDLAVAVVAAATDTAAVTNTNTAAAADTAAPDVGGRAPRDGRVVGDVVARVAAATGRSPDTVAGELRSLVADGVLVVGHAVPLDGYPEEHVRRVLATVGDDDARRRMTEELRRAEELRSGLARAIHDPLAVHDGLAALTAHVEEVSGSAPAPRGQGGRVPAYVDSRRDLDVRIGTDLLDRLRDPLRIALGAARWLAAEVGDAVAEELHRRYAELARRGPVLVSDLYFSAADTLSGAPGTAVHQVVEDYQLRWAEVLATGTRTADGELRLSVADVEGLAAAVFPAVAPRWQAARCHSPDLMLAHDGRAARWVLGELHVALNTTENRVFHDQCDDPERLAAAVARDMAAGRVVALQPHDSPEVSSRTYPPLTVHAPGYVYWSFGADPGPPAGRSYPAAGLVVREEQGRLVVAAGGWSAGVLEVFGEFLSALVVDRFAIVDGSGPTGAAQQPRVVLDDLVLRRRSWRIAAAELAPGSAAGPADLTRLGAQLAERGLPRRVFARTPAERKPFLVDLRAPALLANLVRASRLASATPGATVVLSEMLPEPDGLWLRDAAGRRYTSELRVVAVDPAAADPVDPDGAQMHRARGTPRLFAHPEMAQAVDDTIGVAP